MSDEQSFDSGKKTILSARAVLLMDKTFGIAAGVVLFVLMVVVTVDVIGRYIFSAPLHGGFEYIQICMAMLVFLALPVVVAREENVKVEVFEALIPKRARYYTRLLGFAISFAAVAVLVWVTFLRASSFHKSGELFVLLPAPLFPVAYFVFAMWLVSAVIMLVQFIKYPKFLKDPENNK